MNQNQILIIPEQSENGIIVDFKDLLSRILLGWRTIILFSIVFALLSACSAAVLSKRSVINSISKDEKLSAAKEMLSEEESDEVETLYELTVAYNDYQLDMQKKYTDLLFNATQTNNARFLNISYYISSSFRKLDEVLPLMLLSNQDYKDLDSITTENALSSHERLFIKMSLSQKEPDQKENIAIGGNAETIYLLLVTMYLDSEEQCDKAFDVIDSAINRDITIIQEKEPQTILEMISKDISCDTAQFVKDAIEHITEQLEEADSKTDLLINNRVSALSRDQQHYFDLLKDESIAQNASEGESHVSYGKWIVAGACFGLLLGTILISLRYIFDGTIKTGMEADRLLHSKSLRTVFVPGKPNLFGKAAQKLLDAGDRFTEQVLQMISEEIASLAEKSEYRSVYILSDSESECIKEVAEQIRHYLEQHYPQIHVYRGDPENSVSDLNNLTASDSAVMLLELKRSRRKKTLHWSNLCHRYNIPVIGNVSFEICW